MGESNNLAEMIPEKREEMLAAWEAMNAEMIDPVWTP